MMFTFFAVLVRILINPLSNVFQKRICAAGQSPLTTNFLTYAALSVLVLPMLWNVRWSSFPLAFWGYAALVGVFGALGNGFLVKAVQSGELSVLGPINAWKSVVGIVFGMILLHEIPGLVGFLGVLLIVAGSYFVLAPITTSSSPNEKFSWTILTRPDLCYRVGAMVLAAVEAVFIKKVILYSDPNTAFSLWCWGGMIFSLLLLPVQEKIAVKHEFVALKSNLVLYLGLIVSVGLMQLTTNYVFDKLSVGYALALFQLSAVLSVFYGFLFFRESNIARKLPASLVMVAGSVLIILAG